MRAPNKGEPGKFEQAMNEMARVLWMSVEWFRPDLELGAGAVFHRDIDMVKSADLVLAYFSGPVIIGGTAHVVQAAIDFDTPVFAYGLDNARFIRIGEHDPTNAWGRFSEPSKQFVNG